MSVVGAKGIDQAADRLREAVQRFYAEETVEDTERWGENTVPDFREYHGMRLNKFGILVDVKCGCESCMRHKAREVVDRILSFERGLIRGAGGSGNCEEVTRYFLEDHVAPQVFTVVPLHLRETPEAIAQAQIPDGALKQLRVRHQFGVVAP